MTMCNAGFATTSLGLRACAGAVSPLAPYEITFLYKFTFFLREGKSFTRKH